jgi:hypothetical protein
MALHVPPTCPVCDGTNIRKSRRRNFLEKLPIMISLRPYRCMECSHRLWRFTRKDTPSDLNRQRPVR